jgi:hypothetical protein
MERNKTHENEKKCKKYGGRSDNQWTSILRGSAF